MSGRLDSFRSFAEACFWASQVAVLAAIVFVVLHKPMTISGFAIAYLREGLWLWWFASVSLFASLRWVGVPMSLRCLRIACMAGLTSGFFYLLFVL